jgi:hypothetical protein
MPGLVPGIHVFAYGAALSDARSRGVEDVDGRDKPGHDAAGEALTAYRISNIHFIA